MRALYQHYDVALGDDERAEHWGLRAGDAGDRNTQREMLCRYDRLRQTARLTEIGARWGVAPLCRPQDGT